VKSMVLLLCRERRDSDGWEKTEAYSIKEAGRQSGEKKTEYEGAGASIRTSRQVRLFV